MMINVSRPGQSPGAPSRRWWGEVTSTSPLEVTPDNASVGVPMSGALVGGLVVGDRVLVQLDGTAATVLGKNYTY